MQVMEYGIIQFLMHIIEYLIRKSLSLFVISNKSGILIQSNCNRTEYLSGPPCVRYYCHEQESLRGGTRLCKSE